MEHLNKRKPNLLFFWFLLPFVVYGGYGIGKMEGEQISIDNARAMLLYWKPRTTDALIGCIGPELIHMHKPGVALYYGINHEFNRISNFEDAVFGFQALKRFEMFIKNLPETEAVLEVLHVGECHIW